MQFQILDVDYVFVNDKPILRVFGKTEKGESVCGFYEGLLPFFYAEGKGVEELLAKNPQVAKIETVSRFVVGSQAPRDVYRITLRNPAKTPEVREGLTAAGVKAYEADILFKYRVMNDLGLDGLGWVEVSGSNGVTTETVNAKLKLQIKDIKPVLKDADVGLKYMAFDIECTSSKGGLPDSKRDPIILISLVFSEPFKGEKSIVLSTRADPSVLHSEDEKAMLEEFIRIIDEYDPDIITGYNCNNFDLPYIVGRMREAGVRPLFGRCKQKQVISKKIGMKQKTIITGRIVADSFDIVKKDFSLQRYGLDFVADKLLGEKKGAVKHSEIEKLWKGDQPGFKKLAEYCKQDSVLALNLLLKLNLLDKYTALSKVSGTLLQDTLDSGETTRIENYVLREFNKAGYVFPCRPDARAVLARGEGRHDALGGGAVLEPDKGIHSSVIVLDFKAMYPSIVRTFNICPTTLIDKPVEGCMVTPSGAKFLPKEKKEGIIPKIVEDLMTKRQEIKKKLKRTKGSKARLLDAKQWALKIMANAIYGYFGYARSRLFNLDIANAITSTGRETIINTKGVVEKKYGYRVVYGDTDSVFVKVKEQDLGKMAKIGEEVSAYITSQLLGTMELEFEKIFKRFLPLTKKRYAAWKFVRGADGWEDSIETKGIETVRRDWCPLVSTTLQEIIEIILKKDDVKAALNHFKGIVDKLLKGEIGLEALVVTKTMTKAPKHYVGIQPHIELVKKMQARNPAEAPGIGDRIGYVIVKGMKMLSKRTEDPEYVKEKGLQVDSSYYIENQLLPPLERIFGALGISKSELLGNGKQIGILDALRAHTAGAAKAAEKPVLGELKLEDVSGFMCSKCSKHYPRVPLIGVCGCGGEMLFSSAQGPGERAVVS